MANDSNEFTKDDLTKGVRTSEQEVKDTILKIINQEESNYVFISIEPSGDGGVRTLMFVHHIDADMVSEVLKECLEKVEANKGEHPWSH